MKTQNYLNVRSQKQPELKKNERKQGFLQRPEKVWNIKKQGL